MKQMRKLLVLLLIAALCAATFAMPIAAAAQKVTMTGDGFMRSGAGTNYSIKATLKKGKVVTYQNAYAKDSRGVYWLKVKYGSKVGWVSTRYARLGSNSSKKVVATASVNIRLAPKKTAAILGFVNKGTKLTYRGKYVKDSRGVTWYHVYFDGQNGWISSKYSKLQ